MSESVGEIPTAGRASALVTGITRWALSVTLASAVVCLILAMAGALTPWWAIPLIAGAASWIARSLPRAEHGSLSPTAALSLAVMVLAVVSIGVVAPHEHVLATRDSGTYISTAAWIARSGGLAIEAGAVEFEGSPVVYETLGFLSHVSESRLQPQFLHAFPSMLGLADLLSPSPISMFWVAPLLGGVGLLAFFSLARAFLGGWSALAATGAVAGSLPFLYFTRAPFSETLAFGLVFGGLWALYHAYRSGSPRMATAAGLLIGGAALARIDGVVVLLGLAVHSALLDLGGSRNGETVSLIRRLADRAFVAGLAVWALSLLDTYLFSPQYLVDHGDLIALVVAAILLTRLLGRIGPRLRTWIERRRIVVGRAAATVVAVYLGYAWLLRRFVEAPTKSDIYGLEGLQTAAGIAVDPLRSYAELSVQWLVWYLGIPIVAAGILGLTALTRRVVERPSDDLGPFLGVALVTTLLYVYRPSINPDQVWAMRRFVPVVIPALVIAAIWAWKQVAARLALHPGVSVAVALAALTPVGMTTADAGLGAEFSGAAAQVTAGCEVIGEDSVLLFVGDGTEARSDALLPLLRGWCGVPAAAESGTNPLDSEDLARIGAAATGEGRGVWLLGHHPDQQNTLDLFDTEFQYLEITLIEPPDDYATLPVRVTVGKLEG